MRDTTLHRPRTKTCRVFPLTYRYRSVLVPPDFPIGVGCFIEQDAAHRKASLTQIHFDSCLTGSETASSRTAGTSNRFR